MIIIYIITGGNWDTEQLSNKLTQLEDGKIWIQ